MANELRGVSGPEAFNARMKDLREKCREGGEWLMPGDEPLADLVGDAAEAIAAGLANHGVPWPYAYPSEDGLLLEWDAVAWALSIDVERDGKVWIDMTETKTGESYDVETVGAFAVEETLAMLRKAGIVWGQE